MANYSSAARSNVTTLDTTNNPSYVQFLDSMVKNHDVIILDMDSAQKGSPFEALIRQLAPMLTRHKKQIVVPQAGLNELRQCARSVDSRVREKAARSLEGIMALANAGFIVFRGNPNLQESAGEYIIKYVSRSIWDQDILVITQSGDLAADCRMFAGVKSTRLDHSITVKRISDAYGRLNNFSMESNEPAKAPAPVQANTGNATDILRRFGL